MAGAMEIQLFSGLSFLGGGCRSRQHSFFMSGQGPSDDGFFLSPAWFWRAMQVRICAFPASSLGLSNVAISPDVRPEEGWSMRQVGREKPGSAMPVLPVSCLRWPHAQSTGYPLCPAA